ncbi:MAG: DNA ligase D, partial [Gemmatimonadota bacterium]
PQLATLAEQPPSGAGWVHEMKLDGYRIQALVNHGTVQLFTRSGKDWTTRFPGIATALARLKVESAILDGEIVALDDEGRSSFHRLHAALEEGARIPLQYSVFDLLQLDGRDFREEPLSVRRPELVSLIGKPRASAPLQLTTRLKGPEGELLGLACRLGLEGVVSKRTDGVYQSRRSRDWIKSKCGRRQELVVVGFTEPRGGRNDLGALLLGVQESGTGVIYAGKVGSGFDTADRKLLRRKLEAIERQSSPLARPPVERVTGKVHWVRPVLVAEVSFTEWTPDGLLRHPVFRGLRTDKAAQSVRRERSRAVASTGRAVGTDKPKGRPAGTEKANVVARVTITHPERVIYPDSAISKLELARYYELVAPLMLPHVAGRPLSLVRCPEGQGGTCFYQKHWSGTTPAVDTLPIPEVKGVKRPYAVVKDAKGLVTLVQYGVIEFHPWGSRSDKLEFPDRIILDLDPAPGVKWGAVKAGALAIRDLLAGLDLKSWLKTSGGKGLHVVIPFERRISWELCTAFARAVAERLAAEQPERYVTVASKAARTGKIFVDWLRNSRGATAVAPWSTRAREGAPVSVPVRWDQLGGLTSGDSISMSDVPGLIGGRYRDPWADLPKAKQRIGRDVVEALLDRVGK